MAGILYIVATPIGNLDDMTFRAINVLKEVDLIAAEDTRHTLKLLNHFEISKPLTSYYEHNKSSKGKILINDLLLGKNIALVSDAGTPGISDPGEEIIREAIENGIKVTAIPGSCACINALIMSGLPTSRFVFEGFLTTNKLRKRERLNEIKNETRTVIFYEAPHKLLTTLKDIYEILGDREIVLVREMTKKYEEIIRITIKEAIEKYENKSPLGEFVLIVKGIDKENIEVINIWDDMTIIEHVNYYINKGFEKKDAMKQVSNDRGIGKREVYDALLGKNK